jgi:hypothetical protein
MPWIKFVKTTAIAVGIWACFGVLFGWFWLALPDVGNFVAAEWIFWSSWGYLTALIVYGTATGWFK